MWLRMISSTRSSCRLPRDFSSFEGHVGLIFYKVCGQKDLGGRSWQLYRFPQDHENHEYHDHEPQCQWWEKLVAFHLYARKRPKPKLEQPQWRAWHDFRCQKNGSCELMQCRLWWCVSGSLASVCWPSTVCPWNVVFMNFAADIGTPIKICAAP